MISPRSMKHLQADDRRTVEWMEDTFINVNAEDDLVTVTRLNGFTGVVMSLRTLERLTGVMLEVPE